MIEDKINKDQLKDELIIHTYRKVFNSEDGQTILKDLEETLLKRPVWKVEDPTTDAIMREGAREFLVFIYQHIY